MTTKLADRFIQIKGLTTDDWSVPGDLAGFYPTGLFVRSITFHPSGANDIAIIKGGLASQKTTTAAIATTTTAVELFHVKCTAATDQRVKSFADNGVRMWPFIDLRAWTLSSAALARVEIELA